MRTLSLLVLCAAGLGSALAADKPLTHCFLFTPVAGASDADWKAFYAATDALPGKMPGVLNRVSYGKLVRKFGALSTDAETRKKLTAGEKDVAGKVNVATREYGVCMEFASQAALKTYATHAAHSEWNAAYEKVRVEGTNTFDFVKP